MKAGGPFPHPPPPSPTGSCQSAASSSRKSREPPCEPGRATTAPAPQAPRTGGTAALPAPPALAGVPPRPGEGRPTASGGAPSYSPGAGPTPLGISPACWWAQRGGSSLGAVMWGRGVTPRRGSIPVDSFLLYVPSAPPLPLPQGREDTRLPCNVRVPPASSPRSPAGAGWHIQSLRPPPPSPPRTVYRNIEKTSSAAGLPPARNI